ncbi:lactate utilization protein [Candidatus Enterococcus ferrettii]|uniref:LUD domain-containing protein n=1 Tax=Candidatus Enterococcus ferrettii TaxID=2815324 RepID=A0ABV0ESA1_9ENTE|nr:lactate utilization protein [Enterococcus sp. 665A]MBO1341174.1 lactate utilization protein [Enterococcus sp. 665A]
MQEIRHQYYKVAAQTVSKRLNRRNFQTIICDTLEEAKNKALVLIDSEAVVSFGGSNTLVESGIINDLYGRGQSIIDREKAKSLAERHQLMKKALNADFFLTSINGISEDGQLVNVDNIGNRVAAIAYGPDKVFAFVGINKVYGDLDTTIEMVRKKTAPLNAHRIGLEGTPCIKKGICGDCLNEECICNTMAITRRSWDSERITIFLILEPVGF